MRSHAALESGSSDTFSVALKPPHCPETTKTTVAAAFCDKCTR